MWISPAVVAGVLAVGLAVTLTPLGSGSIGRDRARPTGFPLVWRAADDTLVGLETTPTLRRIHGVWDMHSDKGGKAFLYASWREPLGRKSKAAQCGGLRYGVRSVTETTGKGGEAWFGLVGDPDGTAHLTITHRIAIYQGSGPPICVEASGTVDGQTGVLVGFEGTFEFRNDSTLIFKSG